MRVLGRRGGCEDINIYKIHFVYFIMNGLEIGKIVLENAKRLGIKPEVVKPLSDKEKAEGLRDFYINLYKNHYINGFCKCFEQQKQDVAYNLKAYEIMSNEQILSSEKRDIYLRQKELENLLK